MAKLSRPIHCNFLSTSFRLFTYILSLERDCINSAPYLFFSFRGEFFCGVATGLKVWPLISFLASEMSSGYLFFKSINMSTSILIIQMLGNIFLVEVLYSCARWSALIMRQSALLLPLNDNFILLFGVGIGNGF